MMLLFSNLLFVIAYLQSAFYDSIPCLMICYYSKEREEQDQHNNISVTRSEYYQGLWINRSKKDNVSSEDLVVLFKVVIA
jgi:hypothetical protein